MVVQFQPGIKSASSKIRNKLCFPRAVTVGRGTLQLQAAGFTLLELVIVTLIIALVAGISIPRFFGSIEKAELKSATGKIVAMMRGARARAVAEKKRFSVVIDVEDNKIFAVRGRYDSFEEPDMIAPAKIPDAVKIQADGENRLVFEFSPSGGSSGGRIYITGDDSRSASGEEGYLLTVNPLSGKVKVWPISEAELPL